MQINEFECQLSGCCFLNGYSRIHYLLSGWNYYGHSQDKLYLYRNQLPTDLMDLSYLLLSDSFLFFYTRFTAFLACFSSDFIFILSVICFIKRCFTKFAKISFFNYLASCFTLNFCQDGFSIINCYGYFNYVSFN